MPSAPSGVALVIPVKPLQGAKQRLAGRLGPADRRVLGLALAAGTLRCAACGNGFPEVTPVDVTLLCEGHPQPGQGQLPRYCSSVDQHLAWVRRVIRRASRPHYDDGAEAGAVSA